MCIVTLNRIVVLLYLLMGRAAVFCSSNKQHCLSRSSCDAEIVTCEQGTFIGNYFRDVLDELSINCNVIHHEDNESCIALVNSGTSSYDRKERHVIRRVNYMFDYFRLLSNYFSALIYCPKRICMLMC